MQGYVFQSMSGQPILTQIGNGYRYAGVEYYGECYCGNSVQGVKTLDSACTFPCTGNKTQTCGGNNLISVYMDPTYPPSDEPDILAYTPEGCYTEGYNGRAVAWRQSQLSTTTMTTEVCLRGCRSQNFPLAATEYGGEYVNLCWRQSCLMLTEDLQVLLWCSLGQRNSLCPCHGM